MRAGVARGAFVAAVLLSRCVSPSGIAAEESREPLFAGETLTYAMSWGIFAGGVMTISTSERISFQNHPSYKIELSAVSNDFISKFFVVRDSITSWIDAESLQSLRFEKHTVEGSRAEDEQIDFDWAKKVAWRDGKAIRFEPPVFDSLSAVFYLRTRNLSAGEPVEMQVVSGKHAYGLVVDVLGEESVKTPAGTFRARKVHPKMKGEGLLKKAGDLWIWFADDPRRTPVVIRSKLNFGTLTARLVGGASPEAGAPPGR
ncbi:MAG: DUF3108 domain-containing protein [Thermoanaerobaculia bacterium]